MTSVIGPWEPEVPQCIESTSYCALPAGARSLNDFPET